MPAKGAKKPPPQKNPHPPPLTKQEINDLREAVGQFCYRNNIAPKDIKPNIEQVQKMLPIIAEMNQK